MSFEALCVRANGCSPLTISARLNKLQQDSQASMESTRGGAAKLGRFAASAVVVVFRLYDGDDRSAKMR